MGDGDQGVRIALGDLGGDLGDHGIGRRVGAVLEALDAAAAVVIADHPVEGDHGAAARVGDGLRHGADGDRLGRDGRVAHPLGGLSHRGIPRDPQPLCRGVAAFSGALPRAGRLRAEGRPAAGRVRGSVLLVVVAAVALLEQMVQHRVEHGDAVLHPAARAGQVHHEAPPGHPGDAAAEQRGGRLLGASAAHGLEDARHLALDQRRGLLGGDVGGADAGPAGGDHHVGTVGERGGERPSHLGTVGHDELLHGVQSPAAQPLHQQRAGAVLVAAVGGAGRGDEHAGAAVQQRRRVGVLAHGAVGVGASGGHLPHRPSSRRQSPLLPPDFASTSIRSMTARWSTALIMS